MLVDRLRNAATRLNPKIPESAIDDALSQFLEKRQAMSADAHEPVGLYFGTTGGELWGSRTGGGGWTCLVRNLPEIYSVEAVEL